MTKLTREDLGSLDELIGSLVSVITPAGINTPAHEVVDAKPLTVRIVSKANGREGVEPTNIEGRYLCFAPGFDIFVYEGCEVRINPKSWPE